MVKILAVFIGGGIGSLLRFGIILASVHFNWQFPAGTLLANIISSILLGFVVGLAGIRVDISPVLKLFFITGLCGGFSTFSTFSYETLDLLNTGRYLWGTANIVMNVVLCIISVSLGILIARSIPIMD